MEIGMKDGIVVIAELQNGEPLPLTLELIGAGSGIAKDMKKGVSVICIGNKSKEIAQKLQNYQVDEFVCIDDERDVFMHQEMIIKILKQKNPRAVLVGGTTFGRVLAGKIAYELDTELVSDASKLTYDKQKDHIIISRPAFDGKHMADFMIDESRPSVITIRSGVMGKAPYQENKQGKIINLAAESVEGNTDIIYLGEEGKKEKEIHLDTAKIIVSGGRGMKGEEGFALLEQLAQKIGGEVGCTRPCVDAGWTVLQQQIGQSGIAVKPKLYLAFGVSGSIQHMTGVNTECMIAVNQNKRAAIFQYSDYSVVADAKKILQSMLDQIENGKEFL